MGWVIVIAVAICIVFTYSLCKISRNNDDNDELWYRYFVQNNEKTGDKCTILSDLERDAVNRMKKELLCLFEVNKDENVTVADCIIKNDYENKQAILSNGAVIGFTL